WKKAERLKEHEEGVHQRQPLLKRELEEEDLKAEPDELSYVSHQEQVSLIVRYLDVDNFEIKESFIEMGQTNRSWRLCTETAAFGESISQKIQSRFLILLLLLLICILLLYIILENCKSKKHPPADVNVNVAEDAPDSKEPELPEELMIDNTEDLQTTEAEGENELEDEALPTFKRFSIFS
uniref:Uncharacterized protein n=1 Tax=Biomphalaria glabrata TaxID=6526 RepID=A0A2C9K7H7_BIOGL